jgi:hypothetical protein
MKQPITNVVSYRIPPNEKFRVYDPVVVHLIDYGDGRGSITVACYDMAWTAYFGAMGERTIEQFVEQASTGYLVNKLRGQYNQRLKRVEKYCEQIVMTVQAALRPLTPGEITAQIIKSVEHLR